MAIETPTRPAQATRAPAPPAPAGAGGGGGGGGGTGFSAVDPIKLLKQYYPVLILAAVLGGALGTGAHFLLLKFNPTYRSRVMYEVVDRVSGLDFGTVPPVREERERFMGTQIVTMTSELVLTQAMRDPEVTQTTWYREYRRGSGLDEAAALENLQGSLSAQILPSTNLIRLSMKGRNARDVATIVNAVHRAYDKDLQDQRRRQTEERRSVLGRRLTEIGLELTRLAQTRDRLIQDHNVDSLDERIGAEVLKTQMLQSKIADTQEIETQLGQRLASYEQQLSSGGTITYSDELRGQAEQDRVVAGFQTELAGLKAQERQFLIEGYGDSHPTMKTLRARIEATQNELEQVRERTLRRMFDAQVDGTRSAIQGYQASRAQVENDLRLVQTRREDLVRVRAQITDIRDRIDRMKEDELGVQKTLDEINIMLNLPETRQVRVLATGQIPSEVSFPQLIYLVPAGTLLVLGLVGGVIFLRELMDQRVRGPADVALIPRLRVAGVVPDAGEDPSKPKSAESAFRDKPMGVLAESIRQIRAPLVRRMNHAGFRSLLVMGGMPGSGATTISTNLAMSCAAADERVLLIDANMRRPGLHRALNLPEGPGLADVLAGTAGVDDAVRETEVANLSVLTAGSAHNRAMPERLASEAMARLLAAVRDQYDRVIVDAPPGIVSGDGVALANRCDASILVVRAMQEKRGLVNRLRLQLSESHAELLGVVVNAVRSSAGGYFRRNIRATHEYRVSE